MIKNWAVVRPLIFMAAFTLFPLSVNQLSGENDLLIFDNGDRLSGTFLGQSDSLIYFETRVIGAIKIPLDGVEIVLAQTDEGQEKPTLPDDDVDASAAIKIEQGATLELDQDEDLEIPKIELPELPDEVPLPEKSGFQLLWESTERTLNRFIHDRVPDWFPRLPENWKGNVKLGFNYNDSVRTSSRYYGQLNLEGDLEKTNYRLLSHFSFARQDKVESENDWGLSARYRYKLRQRDFLEALASHDVDELFEPNKRSTFSVGFGWKPVQKKDLKFDFVVGGAIESVDRRDRDLEQSFKININENFMWRFNPHMSLKQSLRFYMNPEESENYNFRFDAGLETLLIGAFNLGLSYRVDYDSTLANERARQKTRIITSLGVKF